MNLRQLTRIPLTVTAVLLLFLGTIEAVGQENVQPADTGCIQKDLPDVIRAARNKPPKVKPEEGGSLLIVPIIGSNPATGFIFGLGGQFAFKMPGTQLYSNFSGSAQYTTKNQMIFMLKNNVYTNNNRFFLSGDWRYLIYSQTTYGLGTTAPEGGILDYQYGLAGLETTDDSLAQPMKFNFLRFHQSVSYNVAKGLYAGIGYMYDGYSKIEDQKLNLEPGDTLLTSHYAYSTHYGFSTSKYHSSEVNLNIVYDTRDNMLNAYRGYYFLASWRGGFKFIGNENTTNYFQFEYRSFHPLSSVNPRHQIAFWAMGNFTPSGKFPYLILPATGYDQRGRSGRGYTQGRFRGANMVYGEAEYRFPISRCTGILGGVVFVNATTADNSAKSLGLFESVKPGYGAGLRIMVDKRSRTNLAVDIGFGERSSGFYLAASEAF